MYLFYVITPKGEQYHTISKKNDDFSKFKKEVGRHISGHFVSRKITAEKAEEIRKKYKHADEVKEFCHWGLVPQTVIGGSFWSYAKNVESGIYPNDYREYYNRMVDDGELKNKNIWTT